MMPSVKRTRSGTSLSLRAAHLYNDEESDTSLDVSITENEIDVTKRFTQSVARSLKRKRATSIMTQHLNVADAALTDDAPAQAGILLKLELFNFMCHEAFSIQFGEQTNFIIGRNGSGKSAILTGISVALGAKASDTDRGSSLKSMIMHGKSTARAVVTIKNEGPEAYLPDDYGRKIIIERILKFEGTPSCNIKNSSGKVVSNKKKTIDEILDYFGITIANPMTILTQTEAKTFLAQSDDYGKFKYFMEGTRLQESVDDTRALQLDVREIKHQVLKFKQVEEEKKLKFEKAKEVFKSFQSSDEYRRRETILSGKRLWLELRDKELKLEKAQDLLQEKNKGLEDARNAKTRYEEEMESNEARITELRQISYMEEISKAGDQLNDIRLEGNEFKRSHQQCVSTIERSKQEIEQASERMAALKERIALETRRLDLADGDRFQKYSSLKDTQTRELEDLNEHREKCSNLLNRAKEKMNEKLGVFDAEIQQYRTDLNSLNQEMRSMPRIKEMRPEYSFPRQTQDAIREFKQNSTVYKGRVLGPIGLHVELKQEYKKWHWVLETLLQRSLHNILVESNGDASRLRDITRRTKSHAEITVRRPEVFNFSGSIPNVNALKLMDALKISDDNVLCHMVDINKIQNTLLVEDRIDAERLLMADREDKIHCVICLVGGGSSRGSALRISKRNGTLQTDPITPKKNWVSLRVIGDNSDPLARINAEITELRSRQNEVEHRKRNEEQTFKQEIRHHEGEIRKTRGKIGDIEKALEKVQNTLDDLAGGTAKLETYKESLSAVEIEMGLSNDAIRETQKELNSYYAQIEETKSRYREKRSELKALQEKQKTHESTIITLEGEISFVKGGIIECEKNIASFQNHIDKLTDFIENTLPPIIGQLLNNAEELCSREEADIRDGDTVDELDQELASIRARLRRLEEELGISREEAENNVLEARGDYNSTKKSVQSTTKLHNQLNHALQARVDNLSATTKMLIQEVNAAFESALRLRKFKGEIKFDVNAKTLSLHVSTEQSEELRNVESFSGGEKSYAQIAFLLAIWKPMHSRVRGLDEFDVFMDQINRRLALKLILEKVSENPKTQTIFITPLAITEIPGLESSSVTIREIHPPERHSNA